MPMFNGFFGDDANKYSSVGTGGGSAFENAFAQKHKDANTRLDQGQQTITNNLNQGNKALQNQFTHNMEKLKQPEQSLTQQLGQIAQDWTARYGGHNDPTGRGSPGQPGNPAQPMGGQVGQTASAPVTPVAMGTNPMASLNQSDQLLPPMALSRYGV